MTKFSRVVTVAMIAGLAFVPLSSAAPYLNSTKKAESRGDVVKVGLRHTHRHCHVVVTLGHVKKRCHKHRHNKVVHHGANYH